MLGHTAGGASDSSSFQPRKRTERRFSSMTTMRPSAGPAELEMRVGQRAAAAQKWPRPRVAAIFNARSSWSRRAAAPVVLVAVYDATLGRPRRRETPAEAGETPT